MNDPIALTMIAVCGVVVLFAVLIQVLRWSLLVNERLDESKRTNELLEQLIAIQKETESPTPDPKLTRY